MIGEPAIHLWLHGADTSVPQAMLACLTDAERSQALRFHRPQDRMQRLATASYKRMLLARALECDPAALRFGAHPQGKPCMVPGDGPFASLEFNVSHTDGAIAVAIGATALGVDIEYTGASEFEWDLAPVCFNLAERDTLAAVRAVQRSDHAYALWTRKEALLKATGQGLAVSPLEVDTGVSAGASVFDTRVVSFGQRHWRIETQRIEGQWIVSIATLAGASSARWYIEAPNP